ncbi:DUF397 domain-containing protein [Streptomyces sp. W16]|uniref:DUF397 domain-containing protein n=1 Tax=Streptomyces sp. W16 TaxID=3076631 RepID=UPI00295AC920|nr:DUF397 domain-containing protein [Streptomyces sp. W16]MDV9174368.1 DUF397 domain-containing protein [Streptomyces sp. W16]
MIREPELAWFKSSYSDGPDGDSCVEIATVPGAVHIRDSKNTEGPRFTVTPAAWTGFVHQLGEA